MFHSRESYLILTIVVVYTHQQIRDPAFMATYAGYQEECAKEIGLEVDYVRNVAKENHYPNDDKLKCYFKCVQMKLGILDENGEVVDEVLGKVGAQLRDEATEKEIVEECGPIRGADLCETAFQLAVCVKNATLD